MNKLVLYHVSNPVYRESILKNGLIPQVGESYIMHRGENEILPPVVFLSINNDYDTTWDDDRYEVTLYINKFILKPDLSPHLIDKSFMCHNAIPPACLKLIHRGTGASTF